MRNGTVAISIVGIAFVIASVIAACAPNPAWVTVTAETQARFATQTAEPLQTAQAIRNEQRNKLAAATEAARRSTVEARSDARTATAVSERNAACERLAKTTSVNPTHNITGDSVFKSMPWAKEGDRANARTLQIDPKHFDWCVRNRPDLERVPTVVAIAESAMHMLYATVAPKLTATAVANKTVRSKGVVFNCERLRMAYRSVASLRPDTAYAHVGNIMTQNADWTDLFDGYDAKVALERCR